MIKLVFTFIIYFHLFLCFQTAKDLKTLPSFFINELKFTNNTPLSIPAPRSMVLSSNKSILYVSSFNFTDIENVNGTFAPVYAIIFDPSYRVKKLIAITKSLKVANGIAFGNGSLYVALVDQIQRYDNVESRLDKAPLDPSAIIVNSSRLPNNTWHGWRYIRFSPDGKLYLAVGAPCNIPGDQMENCVDDKDNKNYFGKILRMNPDGSNIEVFAKGIRNSVGFDFHPFTKELWFTDNGRDKMNQTDHNNMPPDELNHAPTSGLHFGFPFCYGKNLSDNIFNPNNNCSSYTGASVELSPHVAAIGMRFYNYSLFPGFRNSVFIAEHGSWNRNPPSGYRVTVVKFNDNGLMEYINFVNGWLTNPAKNCTTDKDCEGTSKCLIADGSPYCSGWGRPADVEVLPDGTILVSDEIKGIIYRVTYSEQESMAWYTAFLIIIGIFITILVIVIVFYFMSKRQYIVVN